MTNQEIMQEIKDLRKEQLESRKEIQNELKDLKREFYLFKGKSFGFLTFLTTGISFLIDFIKHR